MIDLIVWYFHNSAHCYHMAGLLVVTGDSKSIIGGWAVSYRAPLLWNQLPVWVWEADTLSNFRIRLKTLTFDKTQSQGWLRSCWTIPLLTLIGLNCSGTSHHAPPSLYTLSLGRIELLSSTCVSLSQQVYLVCVMALDNLVELDLSDSGSAWILHVKWEFFSPPCLRTGDSIEEMIWWNWFFLARQFFMN